MKGKKLSILILVISTFFQLSKSQEFQFRDMVHSRSFCLNKLAGIYDIARTKNLLLSLIKQPPKEDFEQFCSEEQLKKITKENLTDVFLIFQPNEDKKECIYFRKSDIKLIFYYKNEEKLISFFSQKFKISEEKELKIAYKFIIVRMSQSGLKDQKAILPKFYFKETTTSSPYKEIIYEIPYDKKEVEIEMKSFIFTSSGASIFGLISLPKFLLILILLFSSFWFHLGMHEKQFPLHLIMIGFSWIYLFLIIASLIKIENTYINTAILMCFVIFGVILMQFLKYEQKKKIAFWMNFIILFEVYCETVDLMDNGLVVLIVEIIVFIFLAGLGRLILALRDEIKLAKGVNLMDEAVVTGLFGMKMVVYLARANEPLRNPLFSIGLFEMESTLPEKEKTVELILIFSGLLLGYFLLRFGVILHRRRKKASREDDYNSDSGFYVTKGIDQTFDNDDSFAFGRETFDLDESGADENTANLLKI